jgi:cellulose synthase/poly-beta-1,6-N-acetylglucosamine synthase-like glycosyltransferase
MLGATGALYAIRKELFPTLPNDLLLDDVYIPMKIVERGYRAIFDKKAKVYDKVFANPKEEFLRRVRTLAGNYQLFFYLGSLFNPLKGKISWQFFSHKFLRLTVPFLLIAIFIINALLLDSALYKFFFILQISFYALALLGLIFKQKNRVIDIPYMFCVMNSAAAVGLYRLLTRRQDVLWEKTDIVG